jgi:hypothetical protein
MQIQLPYDHTQQIPLLSQDIGEWGIFPQHQKKKLPKNEKWKHLCFMFKIQCHF